MTAYKFPSIHDMFGDIDRFFVGYDDTFKRLNTFTKDYAKTITSNYPPFNVKKDRKSTRLNSSHMSESRMPSSA